MDGKDQIVLWIENTQKFSLSAPHKDWDGELNIGACARMYMLALTKNQDIPNDKLTTLLLPLVSAAVEDYKKTFDENISVNLYDIALEIVDKFFIEGREIWEN